MAAMMYQVQVPAGVSTGQMFTINVNGQHMQVQCPVGAQPGTLIQVQVAAPAAAPAAPQQPPAVTPESVFAMVDTKRTGHIKVDQLKVALERLKKSYTFSIRSCKTMMNMFDADRSGTITLSEFTKILKYVNDWTVCFQGYDRDNSGTVDMAELKTALTNFGYVFSDPFYAIILKAYDERGNGTISLDDFIQTFCELHTLTEAFKAKDHARTGSGTFSYEEFLRAVFSIRT